MVVVGEWWQRSPEEKREEVEAEFAGWRVTFHSARRGGGSFVLRNCLNFPATTKDHRESLVGDTLRSTLEGERAREAERKRLVQ